MPISDWSSDVCSSDLTEALCLAHDIGHPPFGHAGEEGLQTALKEQGGFDHNAQTLRTLMLLESPYPRWQGLNLSWETLEGLAKHNGPVKHPGRSEEHTSELQSLMRHTYAVFCLKKNNTKIAYT